MACVSGVDASEEEKRGNGGGRCAMGEEAMGFRSAWGHKDTAAYAGGCGEVSTSREGRLCLEVNGSCSMLEGWRQRCGRR